MTATDDGSWRALSDAELLFIMVGAPLIGGPYLTLDRATGEPRCSSQLHYEPSGIPGVVRPLTLSTWMAERLSEGMEVAAQRVPEPRLVRAENDYGVLLDPSIWSLEQ